jgi:hypothetical protein
MLLASHLSHVNESAYSFSTHDLRWPISLSTHAIGTRPQPDGTWTHAENIKGITQRTSDGGSERSFGRLSASSATLVTSAEVTNHGKAATSATVSASVYDEKAGNALVGSSTVGPMSIPAGATGALCCRLA